MAAWTLRASALQLHSDPREGLRRYAPKTILDNLRLPPTDYYLYERNTEIDDGDDAFGVGWDYPIARNLVEDANKLYVERNIYAHLNTSFRLPVKEHDAYQDERIDLEALTTKPPSFIFIGKPGVGKSTIAAPLAAKLNAVLISPESIAEYYLEKGLPEGIDLVNYKNGTLNVHTIMALLLCRLFELDVFHRGYVMDGFPIIGSTEVSVENQMKFLYSIPQKPDYIIILHMQDLDLYNRRRVQKYDPITNIAYTLKQYMAAEVHAPGAELEEFSVLNNRNSVSSDPNRKDSTGTGNMEDSDDSGPQRTTGIGTEIEFKPLDARVLGRLISRREDRPMFIKRDIENHKAALPYIQMYIDTYESRKVLELSAYVLPHALAKMLDEFLNNFAVTPAPMPVKLITDVKQSRFDLLVPEDFDELGEESPCIPIPGGEENEDIELDWDVVERTCVIRGRVDPRFCWRMSVWKHLCPVALKYGRSIVGKPQFAVGFMNKVYFLSSEDAIKQFEVNPRPFLLPEMPVTPIKFYLIGHPLAGKTLFATELAIYLGACVIDMPREVRRRFNLIKKDYLFKARLRAVFEITKEIDKQNFLEWKNLERNRQEELLEYLLLMTAVDETPEPRKLSAAMIKKRQSAVMDARGEALKHVLGDTYGGGGCQQDDGLLGFPYKEFKENWRKKRIWPHQKKLELAWKLLKEKKLKYRRIKKQRPAVPKRSKHYEDEEEQKSEGGVDEDSDEDMEEQTTDIEEEKSDESEEEMGEGLGSEGLGSSVSSSGKKKLFRSRRRRFCEPKSEKTEELDLESVVSSVFGINDEIEESLQLRYPSVEIPTELFNPHPKPANVNEQDPLVAKLVAERLTEAEEYADSLPPEIYLEILIRAVIEAEAKYRETNHKGPLTGGWIVENLSTDIEKLKAIIRHPVTAPESIVVLGDNSEDKKDILNNLKRDYITRHEFVDGKWRLREKKVETEGITCKWVPVYGPSGKGDELQGKEGETCGENCQWRQSGVKGDLGESEEMAGEYGSPLDEVKELELLCHKRVCAGADGELVERPSADLIHDVLTIDTLVEHLEMEICNSSESLEMRDKLRQISLRDSLLDITQREVIENWLGTFGIRIPTSGGVPGTPAPPPTAAALITKGADEISSTCEPKKCLEKIPFPIPDHKQQNWNPKKLNYEILAIPNKNFLTDRDRLRTGGSTPSVLSEDKTGNDENELIRGDDNSEFDYDDLFGLLDGMETPLSLVEGNTGLPDPEGYPVNLPSVKDKLLSKIRKFDEFWSMLIPILNKEKIQFFDLGVINEDVVFDKIQNFWTSLEKRFIPEAKPLRVVDLKVEYEEWMDANKLWKFAPDLIPKVEDDEELGEDEEMSSENEGEREEEGLYGNLHKLVKKPEEYRVVAKGIERMCYFGDSKYICPVTLLNEQIIRKGNPEFAAKYLDKTHYLADEEARKEFLGNPLKYLPKENDGPLKAPCPRICVTGSPGCGQEEIALEISKKFNLYYINFRQRVHEALKVQVGQNLGPGMLPSPHHALDLLASKSDKKRRSSSVQGEEVEDEEEEIEKGSDDEETPTVGDELALGSSNEADNKSTELPGEFTERKLSKKYDEFALKNLGIIDSVQVAYCPQTTFPKLENSANRNWKKMNKVEKAIKEFLEYGQQLPDKVLEIFIPLLWTEEPFKSKGFILVGFPNTDADVRYLARRNLYPETVFIAETLAKTLNNRLLRRTMDEWFEQHPGEKKKMKENLRRKYTRKSQERIKKKASIVDGNHYVPVDDSDSEDVRSKDRIYKETSVSAMISRNLLHWHHIYSKDLNNLKIGLNEKRIEWTPIHTDTSLIESKRQLREKLTNCIVHRQSMFEITYDLSLEEAEVLLYNGFFRHSKFGRMCPVEVYNGNKGVNLWHAQDVQKYPILYKGFIYFLAGDENANAFRLDPWEFVQSPPQGINTPLYVVVLGHPKSGKTELSKRLASKLGLSYISSQTMAEEVMKNSFLSHFKQEQESMKVGVEISSMELADEVMAYLRKGLTVPQYISYKILDQALMDPKSQFQGAVFDDYPLEDVQLQEILERGIIPIVVVNLQMSHKEGHRRSEMSRFDPNYNYRNPLPDPNSFMNYKIGDYDPLTKHCLSWYDEEIQCLINIDALLSPTAIFNQVRARCCLTISLIQHFIKSGIEELPCRIHGLCPLTSLIRGKLSNAFGTYDPVLLNDKEELVQVKDLRDLNCIVDYHGELYAFTSDENTAKFIENPKAYTFPTCKRVPPADVPTSCCFSDSEMLLLRDSWGFLDYDPVLYVQGNSVMKALQSGNPEYAVEYKNLFYFFATPETRERFMEKPQAFANIPLPSKLPGKRDTTPVDSDSLSPAGYLIASGFTDEVARMLDTMAKARPKFPFLSATKSGVLYLGYYLKTLNMKSSLAVRTHYRRAMAHMIRSQGNARDLLQEIKQYHGKQNIPKDLKRRLDLFVELADLPDNEKVVDPFIPNINFNYEKVIEESGEKENIRILQEGERGSGDIWLTDISEYNPPPYLNKKRLV